MIIAGLRASGSADEPFLAGLLAQTKALEFAPLPPEIAPMLIAQQREAQRRTLAASGGEQIAFNERGEPIARLVVQARGTALHLVDLTVDAAVRGRGIGTALLRGVIDEASAAGQDVTLQVDPANAVARRLYERAGFVAGAQDEVAIQMRRPLSAAVS